MRYVVYSREEFEHNTDPQRRCYYGCHYSSEWRWSEWKALATCPNKDDAEESVAGWRRIGRKTCEFKAVPEGEKP